MNGHILVIEDEEKLSRMLELELCHEGYTVTKALDGKTGLEKAQSGICDLILLDIMLPELSGMDVLTKLRQEGNKIPIIMLTSRDGVMDKVAGLDCGADDYITKPFAIEELLARIRATLRKNSGAESTLLTALGRLEMNLEKHTVTMDNELIELTKKEYDLLKCLLENKGKVQIREFLLDSVWGFDFMGETNSVDVYIRFLRSKIDEIYGVKLIHTVRGVGYVVRDDEET